MPEDKGQCKGEYRGAVIAGIGVIGGVMQDVPEGGFFSRMIDFVMMKFNGWFGKWFS